MRSTTELRSAWRGRYAILVFDCLLVVGIYFCMDIPSALQAHIEGTESSNCTQENNKTSVPCCMDCLGLGSARYNLLYTTSSWTSAIMVLPVGFFIDKIGNRVSALLFTGIASTGSILFAAGSLSSIRGTDAMFPLMMTGRLLLGAGTGSSRIVRDRILASWFRDKLSLVFGIAVSTMGLGSVCTFVLTTSLAESIGLVSTLFVGAAICCTTFVSAIIVVMLDCYGTNTINASIKMPSSFRRSTAKVTISDPHKSLSYLERIRSFPMSFWVLCMMTATYYSFQLPFTANGSKFLQERYGYKTTDASYINGILFDVAVALSPLAGIILEKVGNRAWVAFVGSLLTVPVGALMLFTDMPPIVGFVWLGITFTFTVVSLWSSIPHTVSTLSLGTANGVASCMLDSVSGLTTLGIGQIMKQCDAEDASCTGTNWEYVYLVLFGHAALCALGGLVLNTVCGRHDPSLNERTVVVRQASFGPVTVSVPSDDGRDSSDSASTISRDSSSANLVAIINSTKLSDQKHKFVTYKPTVPLGVKVNQYDMTKGISADTQMSQIQIKVDYTNTANITIDVPKETKLDVTHNSSSQGYGDKELVGKNNFVFDDIMSKDPPCDFKNIMRMPLDDKHYTSMDKTAPS